MDVQAMYLEIQRHQILFEKMVVSDVGRGIPGWRRQVDRGFPRLVHQLRGFLLPHHPVGALQVVRTSCRIGYCKIMVLIIPIRTKYFNHGMEYHLTSGDDSLRDRPLERVSCLPMPHVGTAVWGHCSVGAGLRAAGRGERAAGS